MLCTKCLAKGNLSSGLTDCLKPLQFLSEFIHKESYSIVNMFHSARHVSVKYDDTFHLPKHELPCPSSKSSGRINAELHTNPLLILE